MTVHTFEATDSPCRTNYALKYDARGNFSRFNAVTIESQ